MRAGKLTERVLKLFIATGKDEVFSLIQALNIQVTVTPVLPTSKLVSEFLFLLLSLQMSFELISEWIFVPSIGCSKKF